MNLLIDGFGMNSMVFYAYLMLKPVSLTIAPLDVACKSGNQVFEVAYTPPGVMSNLCTFPCPTPPNLELKPVTCEEVVTPERRWTEEKHEPEKRVWIIKK